MSRLPLAWLKRGWSHFHLPFPPPPSCWSSYFPIYLLIPPGFGLRTAFPSSLAQLCFSRSFDNFLKHSTFFHNAQQHTPIFLKTQSRPRHTPSPLRTAFPIITFFALFFYPFIICRAYMKPASLLSPFSILIVTCGFFLAVLTSSPLLFSLFLCCHLTLEGIRLCFGYALAADCLFSLSCFHLHFY